MSAIFADTSFYIAFANPRDTWHRPAVAAGASWRGDIVTSEYVLLELGNSLSGPADRPVFLRMLQMIREDRKTTVVPASSTLLQSGVELFADRPDKEWSLTDCLSFTIMRSRTLSAALTCDRHFAQAGFQVLMTR